MVEERKVSQLPTRADITGEEYMHIGYNGRSYKTTVNSIIAKFNGGINLEVLQEIQGKLTELAQMGDLVTAEELTAAIANIPAVDLSSFATTELVTQAITQAIAAIPVVDLSGYATTQAVASAISEAVDNIPVTDLTAYAKTSEVATAITQAVEAIPEVDLSSYAKTADLPVIPDHSDFALKADIPDVTGFQTAQEVAAAISQAAPDLSNLATKNEIPSLEGLARLSDIPAPADLTNIYNKQEIDQKLVDIAQGEAVDLSGYATTVYVDGLIAGLPLPDMSEVALKSDIPDVSGFITAADIPAPQDLSGYVKTADLPDAPDLSGFLTAEDLPAQPDLSGYATKAELPDVSGFLTASDLPDAPDLSIYATKEELPDVTGFFNQTQVQQAINEALASTDDFVRTSETPIGRILWVSGQAIETQDGSMAAPFATLQQAVDRASNDNSAWTILCMPATGSGYTNNVTISAKANILIQGWGAQGAHNVVLKGTVTITGATTTRIRFRDIAIRPPADVPGLVFDGTQGRHYFQNVNVENTTGTTSPIVIFRNGEQRWTSFDKCDIGGRVVIEPTVNANLAVYFNGQNHADCHLEINGGGNTYIRDGGQFGSVEHNAGNLEVKYVGTWTGKADVAIASTAVANRCYVSFCDFESANGYTLLDGDHIVVKNCNALA